eukprot:gnl/MRDRNA2_/MRDRNA2_146042_c0_seq1.p1 gnl/MRDRNA2_/MRDRNA2_146042_c0~~gnl/MRDRNA2_/MRDRNA2_146042_c0_seq1.p1  ORF type:complete len:613 (-),score=128.66 gnl/MRDRNA2_/MRDRNA2_146042_c0_seq1:42-1880(-)
MVSSDKSFFESGLMGSADDQSLGAFAFSWYKKSSTPAQDSRQGTFSLFDEVNEPEFLPSGYVSECHDEDWMPDAEQRLRDLEQGFLRRKLLSFLETNFSVSMDCSTKLNFDGVSDSETADAEGFPQGCCDDPGESQGMDRSHATPGGNPAVPCSPAEMDTVKYKWSSIVRRSFLETASPSPVCPSSQKSLKGYVKDRSPSLAASSRSSSHSCRRHCRRHRSRSRRRMKKQVAKHELMSDSEENCISGGYCNNYEQVQADREDMQAQREAALEFRQRMKEYREWAKGEDNESQRVVEVEASLELEEERRSALHKRAANLEMRRSRLLSNAAHQQYAMRVLARHTARLGNSFGAGLEAALSQLGKMYLEPELASASLAPGAGHFTFLCSSHGLWTYTEIKRQYMNIYEQYGRNSKGDGEVKRQVEEFTGPDGIPELALVAEHLDVLEAELQDLRETCIGSLTSVPVRHIRFAHNDDTERFRHKGDKVMMRGILQLACELLTGQKSPEQVEIFDICKHRGNVYTRTGNRRLAAYRLAHQMLPEAFNMVQVRLMETDQAFLHGTAAGKPKLTTYENGSDCEGRWMYIRETGEAVGHGFGAGLPFGWDLLSLIAARC